MIYGIGTDVCDIRRITATLERQGERFAAKVLGDAAGFPAGGRSLPPPPPPPHLAQPATSAYAAATTAEVT